MVFSDGNDLNRSAGGRLVSDELALLHAGHLRQLHLFRQIAGTETDARSEAFRTAHAHHHLQHRPSRLQHLPGLQGLPYFESSET